VFRSSAFRKFSRFVNVARVVVALIVLGPGVVQKIVQHLANSPTQAETIMYHRDGGFAGYDDVMSVDSSGAVTLNRNGWSGQSGQSGQSGRRGATHTFMLSVDKREALFSAARNADWSNTINTQDSSGTDQIVYDIGYAGAQVHVVETDAPATVVALITQLDAITDNYRP